MATASRPRPSPGVVLEGVTWAEYEAQLIIIGNRPIRVNFDGGRMEIMSPSKGHGNDSYILGWMVDVLVEELDIPCDPADPVTLRRPDLAKGVEPDKLYYFGANAISLQRSSDLDLTVDPPPDLVIEVDVTSSSVPRLPIFAAMGIPEVWRIEDETLQFLHLGPDGTYHLREESLAFPGLLVEEADRFLGQGRDALKAAWLRSFRAYVRETLRPRPPAADEE